MNSSNGKVLNAKFIAGTIKASGNRKDDVFDFIVTFMAINGNSPTLDEICEAVDEMYPRPTSTSKSVANYYLDGLERDGRITLPRKKGRRITAGRIIINEGTTKQDSDRA